MEYQSGTLLMGIVLGFGVGVALGWLVFGIWAPMNDSGPDPSAPPNSFVIGGDCEYGNNTGWAHEVAYETARVFTTELGVAHNGSDIQPTFEAVEDGQYVVRVDVVGGDWQENASASSDTTCTSVELGAGLPINYDEVEIVVDDQSIVTFRADDTTAPNLVTFAMGTGNATTANRTAAGQQNSTEPATTASP